MNQNMHNWIAAALGILTVKFIVQWHKFNKIDNDVDFILCIVDVVATFIFLGIWFFYINC